MKHHHCFLGGRKGPGKPSSFGMLVVLLVLLLIISPKATASLPTDSEEYRQWEEKSLKSIAKLRSDLSQSSYGELASWVYRMSLSHNGESGDRPVFSAAREALLSRRGHVDYATVD